MEHLKKWNTAIYIRLSREDDDKENESESVTSQREILKDYVKKNHFHLVDEYIDDGYTGTNFERPEFQRMIHDVEIGKIDTIITKDLSRLGRNNGKVSRYLDEYFPSQGIRYIAINDNYDSFIENPSNDMIAFKSVFNDYYCGDISKKVRTGLRIRKEKGWFTGWKAPYGYQIDKENKHHLVIDPVASKVVIKIFDYAYSGKSAKQIADILTKEHILTPSKYANLKQKSYMNMQPRWSARTVMDILTSQTYIGNLTQGKRKKVNYKIKKEIRIPKEDWIIVENTHSQIIDKDIFDTVQNMISKPSSNRVAHHHLFRGFLYCKECGHTITIGKSNDKLRDYCSCSYYRKYSKEHVCTPHTINYQKLEQAIIEEVSKGCHEKFALEKGEQLFEQFLNHKDSGNKLEFQINHTKEDIKHLNDLCAEAYIDKHRNILSEERYEIVLKKMEDDIETKTKELKKLESQLEIVSASKNDKLDYEKIILEFLNYIKTDKRFLSDVIDRIYISESKQIEIYFKVRLE